MKKVMKLMLLTVVIAVMSGCTSLNNISEGVSQKSISGSGTLISSRVGLDTATQTPELYNLFVWGDYTSVVPGDEVMRYEETEDASIFNADSKTKKLKIFYASGDSKRMDAFLEVVKNKLDSSTEEGTEATEAVSEEVVEIADEGTEADESDSSDLPDNEAESAQ